MTWDELMSEIDLVMSTGQCNYPDNIFMEIVSGYDNEQRLVRLVI